MMTQQVMIAVGRARPPGGPQGRCHIVTCGRLGQAALPFQRPLNSPAWSSNVALNECHSSQGGVGRADADTCAGLAKFRCRGIQLPIVGCGCGRGFRFGSRFSVSRSRSGLGVARNACLGTFGECLEAHRHCRKRLQDLLVRGYQRHSQIRRQCDVLAVVGGAV
jgi:hypothetical protein